MKSREEIRGEERRQGEEKGRGNKKRVEEMQEERKQ